MVGPYVMGGHRMPVTGDHKKDLEGFLKALVDLRDSL